MDKVMKEFLIALMGERGTFDAWLECNSEKECRDVIIPIVRQRDELLAAARSAILALAHAAEGDATYQSAYEELSAAIANASK